MNIDPPSPFALPPSCDYDAILLVSFGGPERPDDVLPFLENVVRGKNVPRERLLEVAARYALFDGVSPLNAENRALIAALVGELNTHGPRLPVYWGNRNWHPMLVDAVGEMADDGVRHALAFVTSAFGSYSGCRQYLEDIELARQEVGPEAPQIDKLRLFYNHPGFIESMVDRVAAAVDKIPIEGRSALRLIFTAHSIPVAMAERSPYVHQLREACRLIVERLEQKGEGGRGKGKGKPLAVSHNDLPSPFGRGAGGEGMCEWNLVFQSRSGPPSQPWLEPDIRDHLRRLHTSGNHNDAVIVPIGFLAENLEVIYDLDIEVRELCEQLGINMLRAGVVGNHPRFVQMIRELILERLDPTAPQLALGDDGPWPDECPSHCCQLR